MRTQLVLTLQNWNLIRLQFEMTLVNWKTMISCSYHTIYARMNCFYSETIIFWYLSIPFKSSFKILLFFWNVIFTTYISCTICSMENPILCSKVLYILLPILFKQVWKIETEKPENVYWHSFSAELYAFKSFCNYMFSTKIFDILFH